MTTRKTNNGAIFINKEKREEKHPDYQGVLDVEGREYQISGWWHTRKETDERYLSIAIRIKPDDKRKSSTGWTAYVNV